MNAASRDADRVALGQRDASARTRRRRRRRARPTAPPVKRGIPSVGRTRRRGTKARSAASGSGVVDRRRPAGRARRSGPSTGRVWIAGHAVADLEQPPRADAEERVAPEPLAALDRLEQVGGVRRRRGAGTRRSASRGPPGAWRAAGSCRRSAARRFASARLSGSAVVIAVGLGESKTTVRLRDERSCLPRCHPHSAVPHSRDRRVGRCRHRRRSALPCIAGALRRSLLASAARAAPRSVRRLPGPFAVVVVPARTSRRVSGSTCDGYSSRSQPVFVMWPRSMGGSRAGRQAPAATWSALAAMASARCRTRRSGVGPRGARRARPPPGHR